MLPPLHIKLGLVKQFVTALDFEGEPFQQIRAMYPKLSEAKAKGGIFTGPQVKVLLASETLEGKMNDVEKAAWRGFRDVVAGFLGNNKDPNFRFLISRMIIAYERMGCRMSLKLHYLHAHIAFFRENLGDVSEEHGERFHQDIETMERRYNGHWDSAMMGDYVWGLDRKDQSEHRRKSRSSVHFKDL